MKHFDCGHKVENILVFAILLTTSSLNLLEMWPRGEVTTKCVISGSFWQTLSVPNQCQWRSLWWQCTCLSSWESMQNMICTRKSSPQTTCNKAMYCAPHYKGSDNSLFVYQYPKNCLLYRLKFNAYNRTQGVHCKIFSTREICESLANGKADIFSSSNLLMSMQDCNIQKWSQTLSSNWVAWCEVLVHDVQLIMQDCIVASQRRYHYLSTVMESECCLKMYLVTWVLSP